jgi:DNA adenine methylase
MQYIGGKNANGVYQKIINLIPPHDTYIETHLGSGAILRLKKKAAVNIGLDVCEEAIASFPQRQDVNIIQQDAHQFLADYPFSGNEFIYVDPPYLISSRKSQSLYKHEYTQQQHEELLALLVNLPCQVMISGYWSELYSHKLKGWSCETYQTRDRSGAEVTEYLWMNYEKPTMLHDYQYLGDDFRERERIKRKHQRLKQKIIDLPEYEKHFLISELLKHQNG